MSLPWPIRQASTKIEIIPHTNGDLELFPCMRMKLSICEGEIVTISVGQREWRGFLDLFDRWLRHAALPLLSGSSKSDHIGEGQRGNKKPVQKMVRNC